MENFGEYYDENSLITGTEKPEPTYNVEQLQKEIQNYNMYTKQIDAELEKAYGDLSDHNGVNTMATHFKETFDEWFQDAGSIIEQLYTSNQEINESIAQMKNHQLQQMYQKMEIQLKEIETTGADEIRALQEQLDTPDPEIIELEKKLAGRTEENKNLQEKAQQLAEKNRELHATSNKLDEELDCEIQRFEHKQLEEKISLDTKLEEEAAVDRSISEIMEEIKSIQEKYKEQENIEKDIKYKIETLENKMAVEPDNEQTKEKLTAQQNNLKEQIVEEESRAVKKMEETIKRIEELEKTLEELTKQKEQYKQERLTLHQEIRIHTSKLNQLQEDNDKMKENQQVFERKIQHSVLEGDKLCFANEQIKLECEKLREEIASAEKTLQEKQHNLDAVISGNTSQIETARHNMKTLIQQFANNNHELEKQTNDLNVQTQEIQDEIKKFETEIKNFNEERAELQKEKQSCTDQLKKLNEETKSMEQRLLTREKQAKIEMKPKPKQYKGPSKGPFRKPAIYDDTSDTSTSLDSRPGITLEQNKKNLLKLKKKPN